MRREPVGAGLLFLLTLLSTFYVGALQVGADPLTQGLAALWLGRSFALPFMAILLAHEMGHYVAARLHRVDASLPLFLPMPLVLTGTLGAVVITRGKIHTRNALFDIGAAGPWCGLIVAIPVLAYGVATSPVQALDPLTPYLVEGRSLLYLALLHGFKGTIPAGQDIVLSPTALAGWAGLLITMINLVPIGQLDGGHVAYALFGERQNQLARYTRAALLLLGLSLSLGAMLLAQWRGPAGSDPWSAASKGMNWIVWWAVLHVLERLMGKQHPSTDPAPLSPLRRTLAWLTLLLFALLFMPTWLSEGESGSAAGRLGHLPQHAFALAREVLQ